MTTFWRQRRMRVANHRGFTLIELMVVVAIIGILAAVAIALYGNMSLRARIAKAQADARTLGSAISMYSATFGQLPVVLADLAAATTIGGVAAGPFMRTIPAPPGGGNPAWPANYGYTAASDGTFTITASGDGASITIP